MRKILTALLLAALTIPNTGAAQKVHEANLRIGVTFANPRIKAWISGPQSVLQQFPDRVVPLDEDFRMMTLASVYTGLRLGKWKLTPGISLHPFGEVGNAMGADAYFRAWELSVRYTPFEHKGLALYGLGSLARFSPVQEKTEYGYDFNKPFFLPGLGVGANASILHVEVKFQKWPGLEVGWAAEPSRQGSFTWKPIRLSYAVSFLLGIEFTLFRL